jgi:hypothetical protein
MNLFKKRRWYEEILPAMVGSYSGLTVELAGVPCRTDEESREHRYRYSDFGFEFIEELHRQLGEFSTVRQALQANRSMSATVHVRDLPPISVRLSGAPPKSKKAYFSDLADALIDAFEKHGLKP